MSEGLEAIVAGRLPVHVLGSISSVLPASMPDNAHYLLMYQFETISFIHWVPMW